MCVRFLNCIFGKLEGFTLRKGRGGRGGKKKGQEKIPSNKHKYKSTGTFGDSKLTCSTESKFSFQNFRGSKTKKVS
jgi:hypothetical protein